MLGAVGALLSTEGACLRRLQVGTGEERVVWLSGGGGAGRGGLTKVILDKLHLVVPRSWQGPGVTCSAHYGECVMMGVVREAPGKGFCQVSSIAFVDQGRDHQGARSEKAELQTVVVTQEGRGPGYSHSEPQRQPKLISLVGKCPELSLCVYAIKHIPIQKSKGDKALKWRHVWLLIFPCSCAVLLANQLEHGAEGHCHGLGFET